MSSLQIASQNVTNEFGRLPYVLKEHYPAIDRDTTTLEAVAETNVENGVRGSQLTRLTWGDKKECPRWPTEKTRAECPRIQHGRLNRNLSTLSQQATNRNVDRATRVAGAPAYLRISINGVGMPPSLTHINANGNFSSSAQVTSSVVNDIQIRCALSRALFGEYTRKTLFSLAAHVIMFQRILLYLSWYPSTPQCIEKCLTLETAISRVESTLGLAEGFLGDNFAHKLEQMSSELCTRIIDDYNRTIAQLPVSRASGEDEAWYAERDPHLTFSLYATVPEYLLFTSAITDEVRMHAWEDNRITHGYSSVFARDMAFLNRQGQSSSPGAPPMSYIKRNILAACVRLGWSRFDVVRMRPAVLMKLDGTYWYACGERPETGEILSEDSTLAQHFEDDEGQEEEFEGFED